MSLSRRALLIAAGIMLLAVAGVWSGEPLDGFWRWPAVLWLILIAWERIRLANNYALRRTAPKALALGVPGAYTLAITNSGRRTLIFDTQTDHPSAIEGENPLQRWRLAPGETQSRCYAVLPTALGTLALGAVYVRILGCFGLCWWTRRIDDGLGLIVQPAGLESNASTTGFVRTGSGRNVYEAGGGRELLELRDYRPGDALRSIDWKATARRGKPVVRRFERELRLEIALLVDCGRAGALYCGQLQRLQHYINVAACLTEYAARQNDRIACLAYAQRPFATVAMAGGASAVQRIRTLLGSLSVVGEEANPLSAALELQRLIKHRGLVVFLTDIEQPEAASQLLQAVQLLAAKHRVLVASLEDPALAAAMQAPAVQWLDPYRHFAALEYRCGRELTRKKLQRCGVAVVSAAAEQLARQVLDYYRQQRTGIAG
ncbi:MAG: DUF58 domain-containing protein [Gammaproteobacteria bacterium]